MSRPLWNGGSSGAVSECSEDNDGYDSHGQRKPYRRHTPYQIQCLERFYKECAHPDKEQRRQLGEELGLEPKQVKFWLQNKRTQTKAQKEFTDNNSLCKENDRISNENIAIRDALKNLGCGSCGPCGGAPFKGEEKNQISHKLEQENIALKCEYDKVSSMLEKYTGKLLSTPIVRPSGAVNASEARGNPRNLGSNQVSADPQLEKQLMTESAANAMDELIILLRVNQPLWIESPTEEHYVLDPDWYNKITLKTTELKYLNSRMESSKDSGVVSMNAKALVNIFLDPDKWVDLFPTVFPEATCTCVLNDGLLGNRSGSLQLIHEQMHLLSPFVQQREFYLLRCCQQIEAGIWVIVDVSFDRFGGSDNVPTFCWKHPSGCMIEEMPNGLSRVTRVERVEIDATFTCHSMYDHFVKSTSAFGANRWISTVQRTMERFAFLREVGRVSDQLGRGRRGMIVLASKMIKNYCHLFRSFGKDGFHRVSEMSNLNVQFAVHKNTCAGQPLGTIIRVSTSFCVPASPTRVFNYLIDHSMRAQWDVLCNGNQVSELMRIPTGPYPSNHISILRPSNPHEDSMIFQESAMEKLGSFIIYAPFDSTSMLELATGVSLSAASFLASGFSITPVSPDEKGSASTSRRKPFPGGSVVTVAFQILVSTEVSSEKVKLDWVSKADALVSRVMRVLKTAFERSD